MVEGHGDDAVPRDAAHRSTEPAPSPGGDAAPEPPAAPEAYGGRRRTRATLHRTGELSRLAPALEPQVEPALRYDPKTGRIGLPAGEDASGTGGVGADAGVAPSHAGAGSSGADAGPPLTRREARRRWRVDAEVDTTPREEVEELAKAAREREPERSPWRERRGTRIPGGAALPMPSMQTSRAPMPPPRPAPGADAGSSPAAAGPFASPRSAPQAPPPPPAAAVDQAGSSPRASAAPLLLPATASPAPAPAPASLPPVWSPRADAPSTPAQPVAATAALQHDAAAPAATAVLDRPEPAIAPAAPERPSTPDRAPSCSLTNSHSPSTGAIPLPAAADPAAGAPAGAPDAAEVARPSDRLRTALASPATLVGLAAFLVTALGSWGPSLWYGEAAVLSGARRGFGEMLAMLVQGPPSHALATACTWVWSRIAGESELLLRLPSAVAVGLAAAGVVVLGMKGANARAGVLAGILFAVMPRITGIGMNLEGFAWSIALAVWSTVALLWAVASTARDPIVGLDMPRRLMPPALRRSRAAAGRRLAGRWAVCLGLAVLAAYAFPTGGLVLLVHPTVLVLAGARRRALREWALAAIPAALLLAPLVVGIALAGGLDFRAEFASGTAWQQALGVIAPGAWGWLFVFPLVVATARGLLRIRSIIDRFGTTMLELSLAWIILPTLALLLLHAVARLPLHPDYFAIIAPGVALFAGYGLATGPRATAVIAIVLACLCTLPSYSLQRIPPGMYGADGRDAAAYVSARALPGEGLLLDGADPLTHPRQLLAAYPSAFEGLVDIGIAESAASSASLWDASVSGGVAGMRLDGIDRLWAIRPSTDPLRTGDPELETMRSAGFAVVSTAEFRTQIVYELVRTDAFGLEPDGSPPAGPELPPVPTAPPTTYPEPNTPVATVPTTIGPDGIPTAIPSPTPTVDPLAHTTPTP